MTQAADKSNLIEKSAKSIFESYTLGVSTGRDAWCYNYSSKNLIDNMTGMVNFYNDEVARYKNAIATNSLPIDQDVATFINADTKKIVKNKLTLQNVFSTLLTDSLYINLLKQHSNRPISFFTKADTICSRSIMGLFIYFTSLHRR